MDKGKLVEPGGCTLAWDDPDVQKAVARGLKRDMARLERASDRQVGGGHYKDMPIEPGEFIYRNKLGWHEGNAVKYICRHKIKGGKLDIDKAIHYLELLKELEYENNNQQ